MNFTGVSPHRLPEVWGSVEGLLTVAVNRCGEMGVTDLLKDVIRGHMQLWTAHDDKVRMVVVTQIATYPRKRIAEIVYLAGENRDLWLKYCSVLEDWARANGCSGIRATGRPGWRKDVEKLGFRVSDIVYDKDLIDG